MPTAEPTIYMENLTKRFGRLVAVDQLNLTVYAGELFGFLGPNGAGKTTTIHMLTGITRPTSGVARICGHDVWQSPLEAKAITGLLPDQPNLYETLTGRQFVQFIVDLYGIPVEPAESRMAELFEMFELETSADELIRNYSYGMRKKVLLVALLVQRPKVLFLDEPTSGLDPRSSRLARELLRELCSDGATVFMTTHILEIAERMCDRVGIIHQGHLIKVGTIPELREAYAADLSLEDIFLELTDTPISEDDPERSGG